MYSKLVVPLDGSALAEKVLPQVATLIQGRRSEVYLLSVAPTVRGSLWSIVAFHRGGEQQRRTAKQELEEYLRGAAKRLEGIAAEVHIEVRFGHPADEILTFAHDVGADLVAASTHGHGRSGVSRWVFGSVTDRVLRGATCPVLVVPPELERLVEQESEQRHAYRRILVPLDGSELAEQALPYVRALVRPRHTSVFLVSVLVTGLGDRTVTLLTSYPPGLQLATTALRQAEIQSRTYLRSVASALQEQGAAVRISVREGLPADEILAHAVEVRADLIAMTTHGLTGASRWVYGNVASKVLQGARSPVLMVRPTGRLC